MVTQSERDIIESFFRNHNHNHGDVLYGVLCGEGRVSMKHFQTAFDYIEDDDMEMYRISYEKMRNRVSYDASLFSEEKKFMFGYDVTDAAKKVYTSYGQLGFMMWAITSGFYLYTFSIKDRLDSLMGKKDFTFDEMENLLVKETQDSDIMQRLEDIVKDGQTKYDVLALSKYAPDKKVVLSL